MTKPILNELGAVNFPVVSVASGVRGVPVEGVIRNQPVGEERLGGGVIINTKGYNRGAQEFGSLFELCIHVVLKRQHDSYPETLVTAERTGQRREPAAGGVEFVSKRNGWLPFAEPPGSMFALSLTYRV